MNYIESYLRDKLKEGAAEFGLAIDDGMISAFDVFTHELIETNKVMNLTAITEPEEIITKHYLDSLSLLKYADIPKGAKMADVGCGAGFPGIPVKIVRKDIRLTSIDSLNKRVNFINSLMERLNLEGCEALHLLAEEACRKTGMREAFDVVTARAVARLNTLAELCLPLVKKGGVFCAMKGAADETGEAKNAIALLGGEIENVHNFMLPQSDMSRSIIIIRKIKGTPAVYPRQTAQISKKPL